MSNPTRDTETEHSRFIPGTPHSVEAFMRVGVDPQELVYKPPSWYEQRHKGNPGAAKMEYELCEKQRMDLLRQLAEERRGLMTTTGWSCASILLSISNNTHP